jgi:hypothetical protein
MVADRLEMRSKPTALGEIVELLTKEIREQLPALYSTDGKDLTEVKAVVKFFCPWSNWTWYAAEFDGKDTFFGLVDGFEKELGYFSLSELSRLTGPMSLRIERDLHWQEIDLATLLHE